MTPTQWTLLDESGGVAVTFTSFLDIDISNEGTALSYPIEEGSFANYNKVQTPLNIRATLGFQGTPSEIGDVLSKLDEYQQATKKISVVTPTDFYRSMTLESYNHAHARDNAANFLVAELYLVEVREVKTRVTTTVITRPKNPTSSDKTGTGKKQPRTSVLYKIGN